MDLSHPASNSVSHPVTYPLAGMWKKATPRGKKLRRPQVLLRQFTIQKKKVRLDEDFLEFEDDRIHRTRGGKTHV